MVIPSKIYKNILFSLGAMVLASVFFVGSAHAAPTTFTVTSTDDSGPGTLRQAIDDANGNANPSDMDVIEFDIPGTGVQQIILSSSLPVIIEKVTIDGYTQTGAAANTNASPQPLNGVITIEIQGDTGMQDCVTISTGGDGSIIKGLSVHSCDRANIWVDADNVAIQGNYLSIKPDGLTKGNDSENGLKVDGGAGVSVGGLNPADRNIIAGYSQGSGGLVINTDASIYGNYVGIGRDGVTDLGTYLGLNITASGSITGGTTNAKKNVISGAATTNVVLLSTDAVVQGNYVGTDYTGAYNASLINGVGFAITAGGSNNLVGGTNPGEGNRIVGSGAGIAVLETVVNDFGPLTIPSAGNALLGNEISNISVFDYPNFGNSNLGLDILTQIDTTIPADFQPDTFNYRGPNPNDTGDSDTGPNDLMNRPILKTAQQVGNQLTVTYDLDVAGSPTDDYRVEFYANSESSIFGSGPGEDFIGAEASVAAGVNKTAVFTVSGDYTNMALTATATAIDGGNVSGFGSTSEYSQNISIGSSVDFDSDGALDAVEDAAPNNGDANNDGTADRLQPTVTSYEIDSTGIYSTLVTTGCSENGTVASVDVGSFAKTDPGKAYPYGLVDFTLNCSRGDTVNVTKYVFVDDQPSEFVLRKYNPVTEVYTDVAGSTISAQAIGGTPALVSTYSITDGGQYDDDGEANGVIVDPVGLATAQSLATTGDNAWLLALAGLGLASAAYFVGKRSLRGVF